MVGAKEDEDVHPAELLVQSVQQEPRRVRDVVTGRLRASATSRPATEVAQLWWALGLAERELGDWHAARRALDTAIDAAGDDRRTVARIESSQAFVVAHFGELDSALEMLARAEPMLAGAERGRLLTQRGAVRLRLGQLEEAVRDLTAACRALVRHGDGIAEVRARINLGNLLAEQGDHRSAKRHLDRAVRLGEVLGQDVLVAMAHHNIAWVATIRGETPAALEHYAVAERGYRNAGATTNMPRLHADHARTLADAHLFEDALLLIERARTAADSSANALDAADLGLTAATISLAAGDLVAAEQAATDSAARLAEQGRQQWAVVAGAVLLEARARSGSTGRRLSRDLAQAARALAAGGWRSESLRVSLLGALVDVRGGRTDAAAAVVVRVRPAMATVRSVDRILLSLVEAVLHECDGDRRGARRAIGRGLRMTANVQAGLGALEARAHAAAHGADLSELGARLAVADGRPRELLERIESTRLMMARRPLVRPPDDATLADLLAELRQLTHAMADADQPPQQRQDADRRRVRVEAQIRRYARMAGATAVTSGASLRDEVGSALGQLGDRRLVAHANLDGRLLAVTIVAGRARLHDLGPVAPLRDLVDALAFTLHRLNRAPGSEASRAAAGQLLRVTATELGERVLPPDVLGGDEAIVVVPTGVLHGVPWGALPQLTGRPVSLSPSLTGWAMAARAAAVADRRPAGFVAGPGLRFAEAEVRSLASRYRTPAVLTGDDATSDRCIGLLGTSSTAHLACHGSFRADNPLFSTLRVADGAVTVYDLERVGRMARTVVLSACSVGTSTEVQGGTLLGLSSALMVFGAASIVAPLSPVDDAAVGATMHRLHDGLLRGLPPSVALSRAGDADQEELDPTAVAFVAIGA